MIVFVKHFVTYYPTLKPQAESMLVAAVLLLLQPIQKEVVDLVFQIVGLSKFMKTGCVSNLHLNFSDR